VLLRSICVFCGSSTGRRPAYAAAADEVGRTLAERDIRLVYGGGNVGLMGRVADAARAAGGEVIGVIPRQLADFELAHGGLTDLRIVGSMHERKAMMAELSDGFITLPGGCGTFEEFCEILTWSQLGLNPKPCGIYNVEGYFDPLLAMLDRGVEEGFFTAPNRRLALVSDALLPLLEQMAAFRPAPHPRWTAPTIDQT
jgi:uncharacterized protein (TIGR00730 family)